MEEVVERSNLQLAYQRVVKNKGAPGVDYVSVPEFKDWLKMHWPSVKKALLEGRYLPRPVLTPYPMCARLGTHSGVKSAEVRSKKEAPVRGLQSTVDQHFC